MKVGRLAGIQTHDMSIAAMTIRIKGHLRAAEQYKGHTLPGVKRGRFEHDVVVGGEQCCTWAPSPCENYVGFRAPYPPSGPAAYGLGLKR